MHTLSVSAIKKSNIVHLQIPGKQTSRGPVSLTTSRINTMYKLVETQKPTELKLTLNKGISLESYPIRERND